MKKTISAVLSAAMLASYIVLPAAAASKNTETITYRYDNGNWVHTREMEKLGRGLVAIKSGSDVYLSWRLLDSEDAVFGSADKNITFNVYQGNNLLGSVADKTNYTVSGGEINAVYSVAPVIDGVEGTKDSAIKNMGNNYFDITLDKPPAAKLPKYETYNKWNYVLDSNGQKIPILDDEGNQVPQTDSKGNVRTDSSGNILYQYVTDFRDENVAWYDTAYEINDCSVGDVDGDGEYEIIVKWDAGGHDNSQNGIGGNVILDAYEIDGTKLWRIDLGKNIRAGAHYTQFLVYDFDGDGKAEMTCKTAPGSTDSKGKYVTSVSHVNEIKAITDTFNEEADYRNDNGYVLDGDEYLTVFNGLTGEAIDTIYYPNQLITASIWGDTYGGRCDRFTADVAYMDGVKPYAVYMRGYYMGDGGERQTACAVSFDGTKLDCKYSFDTYNPDTYRYKSTSASYTSSGVYKGVNGYVSGNEKYPGEGNHNCTVADVDGDGKDEVMTGALCYEINDDDRLGVKWCTFLEHGDALHIGDYDPTHEGFEFFTIHEDGGTNKYNNNTVDYGMSVIDAKTGELLFHEGASGDTGRGIMGSFGMGGYYQFWSSGNELQYANGGTSFTQGSKSSMGVSANYNFRIFWDGDLYDELFDGASSRNAAGRVWAWNGSQMSAIFTTSGVSTANDTKNNPALTADIFGDWREEIMMRLSDNSGLRVYSTTTPTDYKIKTLMQDPVYRSGVAAEQTAYNQPPHIGFYLAEEAMRGSVTSISVASTKNNYKVGESIDKSALTVKATYKNGEVVTIDSYDISGYDPNTAGTQEVTVYYSGSSATFTVTVESGFDINSAGMITGYHGTYTTETLPASIGGIVVKGIAQGALSSSSITKLYVRNDPIEIASNALPSGITIACFEDSDAYNYAVDNNIKYELLKPVQYLTNITFDEDEYSEYQNGDYIVRQEGTTSQTKKITPVTYGVGARGSGGDNTTGIYKGLEGSNWYILGRSGKFNTSNRHAYMLLDAASEVEKYSEYTLSFDFKIPSGTLDTMASIMSSADGQYADKDKMSADDKNVIYGLRAGTDGILEDVWYHYEFNYTDGAYSQQITGSDGETILRPNLNSNATPRSIAFRNNGGNGANTSVYLDNIELTVPLIAELTLHITDKNGTAVSNASVSLDGGTQKTTNSDGNVTFTVEGGKHTVSVSHSDFDDAINSTVSVYTESPTKTLSFEGSLPSADFEILSVSGNTVKVNVPALNQVRIFAAKYSNNALTNITELIPTKTYTNTFDELNFAPDKVFMWKTNYEPVDVMTK